MQRWAHLIAPGGKVLDLACGQGRHARFFAQRGHPVLACDRDAAALAGMEKLSGIETVRADLEAGRAWPFQGEEFAAIIVVNYLHRPLFSDLAASLAPGGVLLYETFAQGNERYGKPSNPAFLLLPDELLGAFGRELRVAGFEQGRTARPNPALVQRLCAIRRVDLEIDLDSPLCA